MDDNTIFRFAPEDIKNFDWTNEYTSFVTAAGIILVLYLSRPEPEAQTFRKRKKELEDNCLKSLGNFQALSAKISMYSPIRSFASRAEAQAQINTLILSTVPSMVGDPLSFFADQADRIKNDPVVKYMDESYDAFAKRLGQDWMAKSLGGIFKPSATIRNAPPPKNTKALLSKLIPDHTRIALFEYSVGLMHLCYDYRLRACWAPLFLVADSIFQWGRSGYKIEPAKISIDGLMGPLFPRHVSTMYQNEQNLNITVFPEYILMVMSHAQMKKALGPYAKNAESDIKAMGYRHRKYEAEDFNMLFDRLCLGLSVERLAQLYSKDSVTYKPDASRAQRHTNDLAKLLQLPLPRAAYKKRA